MTACAKCGYDSDAVVVASWSFFIDRDPPSLNSRVINLGATRWRYAKERDAWGWEFRAVRLMKKIPPAEGLRRVTLTRCYYGRQQERDRDNLAGGMKNCVDAMVLEQLLTSDDPAHAEIHYQQERGSPTGLRVLIEELA